MHIMQTNTVMHGEFWWGKVCNLC